MLGLLQEDIGIEVSDAGNAELSIDWGDDDVTSAASAADTGAAGDGIARGKDALSVLDNPTTRFQFIDELSTVGKKFGLLVWIHSIKSREGIMIFQASRDKKCKKFCLCHLKVRHLTIG